MYIYLIQFLRELAASLNSKGPSPGVWIQAFHQLEIPKILNQAHPPPLSSLSLEVLRRRTTMTTTLTETILRPKK